MTGLMTPAVPDGPSDAGPVHSALGGDVASFSALLDRYRPNRYARALAYLGPPEDAAGVVQETFLIALTRLGPVLRRSRTDRRTHDVQGLLRGDL